eukprot:TRINITY_DN26521_c0_g1_i1.p1 TRINITY_DN26521_c0_g1~~TRINITY_DN26521_c0_g1_i1.p1  ORF type:complete len:478 (+),score=186.90 TRINITY_DN26521_c0_g1_i1:29-1435(+)
MAQEGIRSVAMEVENLPQGTIETSLNKKSCDWSADDLVDFFFKSELRVISLMHIGNDGWMKTLDFFVRSRDHCKAVLLGGERADGSSLFKNTGMGKKSDMILRPRLDSAFVDPFGKVPGLCILCEHLNREGKPLPQSPDSILVKAIEHLRETTGVELHALGEVEYFLGKRPGECDTYADAERGYHATAPFIFGEDIRREACDILRQMGVPIKYCHGEVGHIAAAEDGIAWEQHEIELALAPLRKAADAVILSEWVLRRLAYNNNMHVTFAPMVKLHHAGSGMHFHMSPVVNGKHIGNLTEDANGDPMKVSKEAKWLIAGLVLAGGALMAFGNRVDDSFVRLTQGKEAPTSVSWGWFDRHALVRLPIQPFSADDKPVGPATVEFRLGDGSAHPHLLLAGIAQTMVLGAGLKNIDEVLAKTSSGSKEGSNVPHCHRDVAVCLKEHQKTFEAGNVFPEGWIEAYLAILANN